MRLAFAAAATLLALLCPTAGQARPWQGIEPGRSRIDAVVTRFGEPTTRKQRGPRSVVAYKGDQALSGTKEVQFACRADGVVEEITVFLASPLDPESVEGTFGKPQSRSFVEATFQKVWLYPQKGVTVFFDREGTVEAITYGVSSAKGAPAHPAETAAPSEKAAPPEKASPGEH
jgi:hypothetical protein